MRSPALLPPSRIAKAFLLPGLSITLGAIGGWQAHAPWSVAVVLLAFAMLGVTLARPGWRGAFLTGFAFSFAFHGSWLSWLWTGALPGYTVYLFGMWLFETALHAIPVAALCAIVAIPTLGPLWLRQAVLLPSLWVLHEWLLQEANPGEAWAALGYSLVDVIPAGGLLSIGGQFALTWVALSLIGTSVCCLIGGMTRARISGLLILTVLLVGLPAWHWTLTGDVLRVARVAPDTGFVAKYQPSSSEDRFRLLVEQALHTNADVLVTPETALPRLLSDTSPARLEALHAQLRALDRDLLVGTFLPDEAGSYYTGAVTFGRSGSQQVRKHRLMPFGEYLPFGDSVLSPLRSRLPQPMHDTLASASPASALLAGGQRVAFPICYEAAFGDDVRLSSANAGAVMTLSDDAWNASPRYRAQAERVLRMRALELQKPVLRIANQGPSYWLDRQGVRHEHAQGLFTPQTAHGLTPYARFGDGPALALSLAGVFAALACALRKRLPSGHRQPGGNPVAARLVQRGQALPAAIVFILIMGGTMYLMANTGQLVTEKIRVTNAADAAAYSAGIVQARAMNYDAYTNRAMIANQIAIAQYVSFASWVNYFGSGTENVWVGAGDAYSFVWLDTVDLTKLSTVAGVFAVVEVVAVYFTGDSVQEWVNEYLPYMGWVIWMHDLAGKGLSLSQDALHLSLTGGLLHQSIADDIVKKMDPSLSAEIVPTTAIDTFTRRYAGNDRGRMADVVIRSRDEFTRERRWTLDTPSITLAQRNVAVKRRGGTDLIDYDQWRAVDTLEVHGQHFGCGKLGTSWCGDVKTPMAYSGADVSATGDDLGRGYHGNAYGENETSAERAEDNDRYWTSSGEFEDAVTGGRIFSGIQPSRELRDPDVQSVAFSFLVSKPQGTTLTSGNASQARPSGRLDMFDGAARGGQFVGLARTEVFFDRSVARTDGATESASLFNPYWRARLVAPTSTDKAYAASQQQWTALP